MTYVCDHCGGTFETAWTDEDAQAESVARFGVRGDAPSMAIVCDVCYAAILQWIEGSNGGPPSTPP